MAKKGKKTGMQRAIASKAVDLSAGALLLLISRGLAGFLGNSPALTPLHQGLRSVAPYPRRYQVMMTVCLLEPVKPDTAV